MSYYYHYDLNVDSELSQPLESVMGALVPDLSSIRTCTVCHVFRNSYP